MQIHLNGNDITNREQLHDALSEALELPEGYGRSLDALYDCLTDLSVPTTIHVAVSYTHRAGQRRHWPGDRRAAPGAGRKAQRLHRQLRRGKVQHSQRLSLIHIYTA